MTNSTATPADLDALLDDALEGFDQAASHRGAVPAAVAAPGATAAAAAAASSGGGSAPGASLEAACLEDAWTETAIPSTSSTSSAGAAAAAAAGEAAAAAAGAAGGGSSVRGRGLAFDPLARRQRKAPPAASAAADVAPVAGAALGSSSGAAQGCSGGIPELDSMDDLSLGLSKLLAELAKAEEEGVLGGVDGSDEEVEEAAAGAAAAGSSGRGGGGAQQQQQQQDLHATLRALSEQAPTFSGAADQPDTEDDMMRLLAEHLGALGGGGGPSAGSSSVGGSGGGGAPPEMASIMDSIMQQLLSKDVLYQPMKDIGGKYPEWLEANSDKLSTEDIQRYRQQQGYIQQICCLYETNPTDFPQLIDLLQQMQQCGQPPQEIVDELAPGMQFGADGLPSFGGAEEGLPPELKDCTIQ